MGAMVSFFDTKLNQNKTDYTDIIDTINDGDYNVLHLKQDKLKILVGNIVMNDDLINTPFDDIEVSKNYPNDIEKKQIEKYINSDDDEHKPSTESKEDEPDLISPPSTESKEDKPASKENTDSIISEEDKHIPELFLNNSPSSIILEEDKHIPELVLNSKKKNKKKKKKN